MEVISHSQSNAHAFFSINSIDEQKKQYFFYNDDPKKKSQNLFGKIYHKMDSNQKRQSKKSKENLVFNEKFDWNKEGIFNQSIQTSTIPKPETIHEERENDLIDLCIDLDPILFTGKVSKINNKIKFHSGMVESNDQRVPMHFRILFRYEGDFIQISTKKQTVSVIGSGILTLFTGQSGNNFTFLQTYLIDYQEKNESKYSITQKNKSKIVRKEICQSEQETDPLTIKSLQFIHLVNQVIHCHQL